MNRPIRFDARYTVALEYCGHEKPHHVARFCGDWIGQSASYPMAVMLCTSHRLQRNGALVVVEKLA